MGLYFIAPGIALDVVCIIFGIYMIIYGAVKIMGYFAKDAYQLAFQFDLALGIVIAIVGIVFVCRTARVVQLLSTCIGIVMLVDATFKIQTSIDSKIWNKPLVADAYTGSYCSRDWHIAYINAG